MLNTLRFATKKEKSLASTAKERLATRVKNIGQIMQKHPELQSNSPELYMLAYMKEFGLAES
jgi:hypothetical protein